MHERQPSDIPQGPTTLFWAMDGAFSYRALRSFVDAGGQVRAVLIPLRASPWEGPVPPWRPVRPVARQYPSLPILSTTVEPSALSLALECGIEAFEIADLQDASTAHLLDTLQAEVACVACWPSRIPASVLARFPLGVLNLHPSLLPLHRGPAPLFWTLRCGDAHAGVTVHLMDDTVDTGPILAQRRVELEDGISGLELELHCAALGGELLAGSVRELAGGQLQPRPQEPDAGSYEHWPRDLDFVVTNTNSARWAYNFLRGAAYWGGPLVIDCAGTRFAVREALDYSLEEDVEEAWCRRGDVLLVRCRPGVLRVLIEAS